MGWETVTASAAEKEYFLREMASVASAGLEICLVPLSLLLLRRGLSGIVGVVMMYQYIMIRVTVSPHVAVGAEEAWHVDGGEKCRHDAESAGVQSALSSSGP